MRLSCYAPYQIIPKSRVVHLADKQLLKRHILSYPKIIVSKNPPGRGGGVGGGGGEVGEVGGGGGGGEEGYDTWPMDSLFSTWNKNRTSGLLRLEAISV